MTATRIKLVVFLFISNVALALNAQVESFGIPSFEILQDVERGGLRVKIVSVASSFRRWEPNMDPIYLLNLQETQQLLNISDEQRKRLREFRNAWQDEVDKRLGVFSKDEFPRISNEFTKFINEFHKSAEAEVNSILLPSQRKALNQISYQQKANTKSFLEILLSPKVVEKVEITTEQSKKIRESDKKEKQNFERLTKDATAKYRSQLLGLLEKGEQRKIVDLFGKDFFEGDSVRHLGRRNTDRNESFGIPTLGIHRSKNGLLAVKIEIEDGEYWTPKSHPIMLLCFRKVRDQMELTSPQKQKFKKYFDRLQAEADDRFSGIQHANWDKPQTRRELRKFRNEIRQDSIKNVESIMLPHQIERLEQLDLQKLAMEKSFVEALFSDKVAERISLGAGVRGKLERFVAQSSAELKSKIDKMKIEYRHVLIKPLSENQQEVVFEIFGRKFFGISR